MLVGWRHTGVYRLYRRLFLTFQQTTVSQWWKSKADSISFWIWNIIVEISKDRQLVHVYSNNFGNDHCDLHVESFTLARPAKAIIPVLPLVSCHSKSRHNNMWEYFVGCPWSGVCHTILCNLHIPSVWRQYTWHACQLPLRPRPGRIVHNVKVLLDLPIYVGK